MSSNPSTVKTRSLFAELNLYSESVAAYAYKLVDIVKATDIGKVFTEMTTDANNSEQGLISGIVNMGTNIMDIKQGAGFLYQTGTAVMSDVSDLCSNLNSMSVIVNNILNNNQNPPIATLNQILKEEKINELLASSINAANNILSEFKTAKDFEANLNKLLFTVNKLIRIGEGLGLVPSTTYGPSPITKSPNIQMLQDKLEENKKIIEEYITSTQDYIPELTILAVNHPDIREFMNNFHKFNSLTKNTNGVFVPGKFSNSSNNWNYLLNLISNDDRKTGKAIFVFEHSEDAHSFDPNAIIGKISDIANQIESYKLIVAKNQDLIKKARDNSAAKKYHLESKLEKIKKQKADAYNSLIECLKGRNKYLAMILNIGSMLSGVASFVKNKLGSSVNNLWQNIYSTLSALTAQIFYTITSLLNKSIVFISNIIKLAYNAIVAITGAIMFLMAELGAKMMMFLFLIGYGVMGWIIQAFMFITSFINIRGILSFTRAIIKNK